MIAVLAIALIGLVLAAIAAVMVGVLRALRDR
jgi:hypothetical protein